MPGKSWINMCNKSCRRLLLFIGCLLLFLSSLYPFSHPAAAKENQKVLVVYATPSGSLDENVRLLDLLLGHFTDEILFVEMDQFSPKDLAGVTHLVYYGGQDRQVPETLRTSLEQFPGSVLAIGENTQGLGKRFAFLTVSGQVVVHKIDKASGMQQLLLDKNAIIHQVDRLQGETLQRGWKSSYSYPLYMRNGNTSYFASKILFNPFHYALGDALHSFFGQTSQLHEQKHSAYIRLEDVHPLSDPRLLQDVGNYLADQQIPFMIALIPVYTNPVTLQTTHLKDSPELVKVLRHLQSRGGSIVLHGYTHQYRSSETGEGFEFWDVKNNAPIAAPPEQKGAPSERHHFASKEQYEAYQKQRAQFEENYITERLEKGKKELTDLGLIPLAFEAPHYTISQKGYEIVSHYFTYILGQAQLGDRDWEIMGVPPYQTKPTFLKGMTLLPETAGYYDPSSLSPTEDMIAAMEKARFVDDSVFGMFYHPYLGVEGIKPLIRHMQSIPNLSWINLQELTGFSRDSRPLPPFEGDKKLPSEQQWTLTWANLDMVELILWAVAAIVTIMVLLFALYTLRNRMNLRKELFKEQNTHG
ncbi:MAG TPA: polysaccharide deacetylase family protein [Candidatus Bathyarchaeia archaeon]|nr:polysaccharide deacetylase family protein [Candidatus Bathyarchaeia archaeon]